MTPEEWQRRQAAMIEAIGDRTLQPTPGGAAGRAAAEHHAAAGLRARWHAVDIRPTECVHVFFDEGNESILINTVGDGSTTGELIELEANEAAGLVWALTQALLAAEIAAGDSR
jgi:hypothetical protein